MQHLFQIVIIILLGVIAYMMYEHYHTQAPIERAAEEVGRSLESIRKAVDEHNE